MTSCVSYMCTNLFYQVYYHTDYFHLYFHTLLNITAIITSITGIWYSSCFNVSRHQMNAKSKTDECPVSPLLNSNNSVPQDKI